MTQMTQMTQMTEMAGSNTDSSPWRRVRSWTTSSDFGRWHSVAREAHPALRGLVSSHQGYAEDDASFGTRLELPHTGVVLIVNLRAGLTIAPAEAGCAVGKATRRQDFVAGVHDHAVAVAGDGLLECLEIRLSPIAAGRLLGVSMDELRNASVCPEALLGADYARLRQSIGNQADWPSRFDLLDDFLIRRLRPGTSAEREVVWACERLQQTSGSLPISELARQLGRSRKHVASLFRSHVGVPAKVYARIVRFDRARSRLNHLAGAKSPPEGGGGMGLAELALDLGYFDQAHFNRDFREFAGVPPSDYVRRAMPDGGTFGDL